MRFFTPLNLICFIAGVFGSMAGRIVYEHYFRWRIERASLEARQVKLLLLKAKLARELHEDA